MWARFHAIWDRNWIELGTNAMLRTKLDHWCEAIIEAGWLAALIVTPLFFNVFSSRVFEPDKISLVRTTALIMLLAWLIKLINGGPAFLPAHGSSPHGDDAQADATPERSWLGRMVRVPFVLPVLLILFSYAISTALSVAPRVSWWGSYQRLQGTYTFVSYVIIALLTAAHLRTPDQIRRLATRGDPDQSAHRHLWHRAEDAVGSPALGR